MNRPLLSILAISGILLSACQRLPTAGLAGAAGVTPTPQEVWVDRQGFLANPQDLSTCTIKAKVITQKEHRVSGDHKNLLNQLKDTVQDLMEQDNELKICMQGKNYVKINQIANTPTFPWPPPRASAMEDIPITQLVTTSHKLGHIDSQITKALHSIGVEYSYFSIPRNGYALVTKLEKINADGSPKSGLERWEAKLDPTANLDLKNILNVLFNVNAEHYPGHYRIIVFIISSIPVIESNIGMSKATASELRGSDRLPNQLSNLAFDDKYRCTALVYEFEQENKGTQPYLISSGIPVYMHLEASGFYKALN